MKSFQECGSIPAYKEKTLREGKKMPRGIGNNMMTRQHFQFIADVIYRMPHTDADLPFERDVRAEVAHTFARELRKTNSGFDSDRFLKACGIEEKD